MTLAYPHRIRLRGPWECEPLASLQPGEALPAPQRLTLPCDWGKGGLDTFAGRVRLRRRFGYPGRLDPEERVWLTFADVSGPAAVWLNGQLLEQQSEVTRSFAYDVTALLRPRNELVVVLELATPTRSLWGEVALEIRRTAYLHQLRAWLETGTQKRIHLTGQLHGHAEHPLDIYVLWKGKLLLSATFTLQSSEQRFHLVSEPFPVSVAPASKQTGQTATTSCLGENLPAVGEQVQVELAGGGICWDQQTLILAEKPMNADRC